MSSEDQAVASRAEGRRAPAKEQAPLFVLLALVCLLVLLGFFLQGDSAAPPQLLATGITTERAVTESTAPGSATSTTLLLHPIGYPVRIVIPAIGVDAPVIPVGLLKNGEMETPSTGNAGWYSLGPAPGEPGPAVIIAHVDTVRYRDVFYNLKNLHPFDEILVYGDHSEPAVFMVDWLEYSLKAELPRDRIWDYSQESLIRLITCGGDYSRRRGGYLSNVIVYGHLVR